MKRRQQPEQMREKLIEDMRGRSSVTPPSIRIIVSPRYLWRPILGEDPEVDIFPPHQLNRASDRAIREYSRALFDHLDEQDLANRLIVATATEKLTDTAHDSQQPADRFAEPAVNFSEKL